MKMLCAGYVFLHRTVKHMLDKTVEKVVFFELKWDICDENSQKPVPRRKGKKLEGNLEGRNKTRHNLVDQFMICFTRFSIIWYNIQIKMHFCYQSHKRLSTKWPNEEKKNSQN